MTDTAPSRFRFRPLIDRFIPDDADANRFTQAALERHKYEGLEMAVRARWIALSVIALLLPVLNFSWDVLWYEGWLVALAGMGWLQKRVGRPGKSRLELAVLFLDLTLLTLALVLPNPFSDNDWPTTVYYQFSNFMFFFVILASGTLAYSWRTITAIGTWTAGLWTLAAFAVAKFGHQVPDLSRAAETAFGQDPDLLELLDPNRLQADMRLQEVVVFVIVASVLAVSIRRLQRLVLSNAALERERSNLSRYFSPRVVEALSHNDDPLKEIREHEVAVLFVDIEGFTSFAASRTPQEVIAVLRRFHAMMESRVFAHDGTLDKFLGDGLMATFGTPLPGDADAANALHALKAMMADMAAWNAQRTKAGEPEIKARFGLHYGPVVLGDIGATQLEFAVIGNTVNLASRLEALTREIDVQAVISTQMRDAVVAQNAADLLDGFIRQDSQRIRGIDGAVTVWTLGGVSAPSAAMAGL